jgi:hypothetical protein
MLEMILDKHVFYVLMGILAVIGILSKLIVTVVLKRMVKAAANMSKSTHPLMRLVRAKFEHACMVSDKVENVDVFVDKYLYEYKKFGIRLHSLRRLENASAGLCLLLGAAGAMLEYWVHGMNEQVLRLGAAGAALAILVYLVHLMTDENYRLEAAKTYMVDYLENVCLHRYEKANQKELKLMTQEPTASEYHAAQTAKTSRSEYGKSEYGKGEYGKGEYGKGEYGKSEYGKGEYGKSEYGKGECREDEYGKDEYRENKYVEREDREYGECGYGESKSETVQGVYEAHETSKSSRPGGRKAKKDIRAVESVKKNIRSIENTQKNTRTGENPQKRMRVAEESEAMPKGVRVAEESEAMPKGVRVAEESEAMPKGVRVAEESEAMPKGVRMAEDLEAMQKGMYMAEEAKNLQKEERLAAQKREEREAMKDRDRDRDILIRQILEEFMA